MAFPIHSESMLPAGPLDALHPSSETADENWERASPPGSSEDQCGSSPCPSSQQESVLFSMVEEPSTAKTEGQVTWFHPNTTKHKGASDATTIHESTIPLEATALSYQTAPEATAPPEMTTLPQAAIPLNIPTTSAPYTPYVSLVEEIHPPRIVTVGPSIRLTVVRLDIEQEYFRHLSAQCLTLLIGLLDADDGSDQSLALRYPLGHSLGQGKALLHSQLPRTIVDRLGRSILRFYFYIDSLRVSEEGSYRFHGTSMIPGFWGQPLAVHGTCFVTDACPEFTFEEMVSMEEHAGALRRVSNGNCARIELVTK